MLFDTHCHLQSKRLSKKLKQTLTKAEQAGIDHIMIPATHIEEFDKINNVINQAKNLNNKTQLYPAFGIHPIWLHSQPNDTKIEPLIHHLSTIIKQQKITTIGEIGLDTEYLHPKQVQLFTEQIKIAKQLQQNLILHSRGTANILLEILSKNWHSYFSGHTVFHCCEPNKKLLQFAKEKNIYIGFDGDITYNQQKQQFIKQVPLELLVIETDAPYLLPEPLKSQKQYPNQPSNLKITAKFISKLLNVDIEILSKTTTQNACQLFNIETK